MKIKWKSLVISLIIPLIVGGISGFLSSGSMEKFNNLNKPALSPPSLIFPIVWTALYLLMGISAYLIFTSSAPQKQKTIALKIYALQLAVNFLWSIIFFNFSAYLFAFIWLILLWVLILIMIKLFYQISKPAALLQLPYFLWVTFAGWLNLMVYLLNR
ncbi:MAG: TspO/MBR family protein [Bacillota bacterium]|nr:TspO/MBR family protein [Bacillota bacterium]